MLVRRSLQTLYKKSISHSHILYRCYREHPEPVSKNTSIDKKYDIPSELYTILNEQNNHILELSNKLDKINSDLKDLIQLWNMNLERWT